MSNLICPSNRENNENSKTEKLYSLQITGINSTYDPIKYSRNNRGAPFLLNSEMFNKSQIIPNFQSFKKSSHSRSIIKNKTVDLDSDANNSITKKNHSRYRLKNSVVFEREEFKCNLENCKNQSTILKYENMIQQLILENERLKNINECFLISNCRKDEYLLSLMKIKGNINHINKLYNIQKKIHQLKENHSDSNCKKITHSCEKKLEISEFKPEINPNQNRKSSNKKETQLKKEKVYFKNRFSLPETLKLFTNNLQVNENSALSRKNSIDLNPIISTTTYNKPSPSKPNNKSPSYYDKMIKHFGKRIPKTIRDTRFSYLSINDQLLNRIINKENYKELQILTSNYEEFVKGMRIIPEEKLFSFCDSISTVIKDFEYSVNLIKRIKRFLEISVRVVNTTLIEEAINMLIKNTCEILDCERASVYVYDKITNMLVIHAGEGFSKKEWKMPIDKGIVGYVFTRGQRQKIDDAYLDKRFNKEIDKETGYTTKSILCVPLKDEYGKSFGVIQALNKKGSLIFSADDEELMDIFADQAAAILQNSIKFDENMCYVSRFKMILRYNVQINSCKDMKEFSSMSENLLASLWATNSSQILIYDSIKNKFFKYCENEKIEKNNGIGIVGKVFNNKEILAINSTYDNPFFNNLIDLETGFPLITFPILDFKKEKKIIAICQVGYPHKTVNNSNKPKDMDVDVINFYCEIASFWLSNFYSRNYYHANNHHEKA